MNRALYYDTRCCNLNLIYPRYNYATEGGCPFTVRSIKDRNSIPRSLRVLDNYSRLKKAKQNKLDRHDTAHLISNKCYYKKKQML